MQNYGFTVILIEMFLFKLKNHIRKFNRVGDESAVTQAHDQVHPAVLARELKFLKRNSTHFFEEFSSKAKLAQIIDFQKLPYYIVKNSLFKNI